MNLTYYGHSCFLAETGGKKLLFDPFISGNELAKNVEINNIEADFSNKRWVVINGITGLRTHVKSTIADVTTGSFGPEYEYFLVMHNGKLYIITMNSENITIFNQLLLTFKFTK